MREAGEQLTEDGQNCHRKTKEQESRRTGERDIERESEDAVETYRISSYLVTEGTDTTMDGYLLGFGNPLLDLVADVPLDFIQRHGIAINDVTVADNEHSKLFEELVDSYSVSHAPGGATLNTLRVAQWLLQCHGVVRFVGAVGTDAFASLLRAACEKDGVTTYLYEADHRKTGTCAVLNVQMNRAFVANLDAAACYNVEHLSSIAMKPVVQKAKIIYVGGYPLTTPAGLETTLYLADHAISESKVFCFTIPAPVIVNKHLEALLVIIPYTDYLFLTATEAEAVMKKKNWHYTMPQIALELSNLPKNSGRLSRTVVITQGVEPTIVSSGGSVTCFPVLELRQDLIRDLTGTGDAFVGGFLARLCQGYGLEECVRNGHYAARCVSQYVGCTYPDSPDI